MNVEVKRYVLIECGVDRVWNALTTAKGLEQWFCDRATIELAKGGAFSIVSAIPALSGEHRVSMVEPHRLLALTLVIAGVETEAVLNLTDHAGLTRMVVTHRMPSDPRLADATRDTTCAELGLLEMAWAYAFLQLKSYLEHGVAHCRIHRGEDPLAVDLTIDIGAAKESVFKALVEPGEVKKWNSYCGEDVRIEPKVGGRYSFGWASEAKGTDGPDEVVEYKDGHKIAYSWHGKEKTLVSWTVEPLDESTSSGPTRGPRTRLRLQHSGFITDPKIVMEYKLGWADFLFCLAMRVSKDRAMSDSHGKGGGPGSS